MSYCPTCQARCTSARCGECGASRLDDGSGATFAWDEPVPLTLNDLTPDPPDEWWDAVPRCKCSHGPSLHSRGVDKCWSLACGCTSFRLKEDAR